MIADSGRRVVVAHSATIGKHGAFTVCRLREINMLVSDEKLLGRAAAALAAAGVGVGVEVI
jgi:DeoR/GlpR family transcriptional regulator of sugar metabolism